MLVKPKCVWEAYIWFENCKQTAENCKQTAEKSNPFWLYQHGVKSGPFQSYKLSKSEKWNPDTLYVGLYIVLGQLMKFSCDTLLTEQKNHALLISRNLVKIGLEWNFDTFTYILRNRGFFLSMSFRGWEKNLFTRPKWRPPSHCLQLFDQYSKAAAE